MVVWEKDLEPHSTFGGVLSQVNDSMKVFWRLENQAKMNLKNLIGIFNGFLKGISENRLFPR